MSVTISNSTEVLWVGYYKLLVTNLLVIPSPNLSSNLLNLKITRGFNFENRVYIYIYIYIYIFRIENRVLICHIRQELQISLYSRVNTCNDSIF